jgi:hypothetical protein
MGSQHLIVDADPEPEEIREQRRAARMQRRNERRRAKIILWGTIGSSILLLGLIGIIYLQIQSILATNAAHSSINGIPCDSTMQNGYHIHVHLSIYINGKYVTIPSDIGIAADGSCFYWMHTHASDGIIHIEAPGKLHNLALDDFLTIWHDGFAKLNFPTELNKETGWKIYVNGKLFPGTITSPLNTEVPLAAHDVVTLEYGSFNPRPDELYAFPPGL